MSHSLPQITNVAVLQGQKHVDGESASEHYFSAVGCNFRVFQGIIPGAKKIQDFQGLPRFVGHPVKVKNGRSCVIPESEGCGSQIRIKLKLYMTINVSISINNYKYRILTLRKLHTKTTKTIQRGRKYTMNIPRTIY